MKYIYALIIGLLLLVGCETNSIQNTPNASTRCEGFIVIGSDVVRCHNPAFAPYTRCFQHR